jgi:hypothetical protein
MNIIRNLFKIRNFLKLYFLTRPRIWIIEKQIKQEKINRRISIQGLNQKRREKILCSSGNVISKPKSFKPSLNKIRKI